LTATTRSSTPQSILRYPIDDCTLVPAKRLTLLIKFRLNVCLELLEGPFIGGQDEYPEA